MVRTSHNNQPYCLQFRRINGHDVEVWQELYDYEDSDFLIKFLDDFHEHKNQSLYHDISVVLGKNYEDLTYEWLIARHSHLSGFDIPALQQLKNDLKTSIVKEAKDNFDKGMRNKTIEIRAIPVMIYSAIIPEDNINHMFYMEGADPDKSTFEVKYLFRADDLQKVQCRWVPENDYGIFQVFAGDGYPKNWYNASPSYFEFKPEII